MLVGLFRKSHWYTPVLLVVAGSLLWIDSIWHPDRLPLHADLSSGPLYHLILPLLELSPLVSLLVAFTILIVQVLYINHIATLGEFTDRFSALAALIYLLIMSSTTTMIDVHPVLFANLFLILALNKIFKANQEHLVMVEVFDVGFLTALAGLFYFPAMAIFLLLIMSLFVYYLISMRAILAALFGVLTPFVFLGIYYFMTDKLESQIGAVAIHIEPLKILYGSPNMFEQVFMLTIGIMAMVAFLRLLLIFMPDKPIRMRKRIMVLFLFFVISLISYTIATDYIHIHHGMVAIPLSISLASFFDDMGRKKLSESVFGILVLVVLVSRFSVYFNF